jgi:hypothetical protein
MENLHPLVKNERGEYGVIIIDTALANNTKEFEIDYDYTPIAIARSFVSENNTSEPFMLRFYAKMSDGRVIDDFYPKVSFLSGLETTDQAQDSVEYKTMGWTGVAQLHDGFTFNGRKTVKFREQYVQV